MSAISRQLKRQISSFALPAAGIASFLLIWELSVVSGLFPRTLVPPPSAVPAAWLRELHLGAGPSAPLGIWGQKVLQSLIHYLPGVAIGSAAGISTGFIMGISPGFRSFSSGLIRILRPIPPLAWIPFSIIWFGISHWASAFIILIGVFWITCLGTAGSMERCSAELREVSRVFGFGSPLPYLLRVAIPESLPGVMTALHTALGMGWMAVVASELFGVDGIGQRMNQAAGLLATDVVLVYMITIAGLYTAVDVIFSLIKRRVLRWTAE